MEMKLGNTTEKKEIKDCVPLVTNLEMKDAMSTNVQLLIELDSTIYHRT